MRPADHGIEDGLRVPGSDPGMLSASFASWAATGVGLIAGLIRGKVAAVLLGAAGVGLISQLNYFTVLLGSLATLGLGNGGIKMLAERRAMGDEGGVRRLTGLLLVFPPSIGILFVLISALIAPDLASGLLGNRNLAIYVFVASLSVPLNLVAGSFQVIAQGFARLVHLARAQLVSAVLNTAVVVTLVVAYGLPGAVAGIVLTSTISLAILARQERYVFGLAGRPAFPGRVTLLTLAKFAVPSLVLGVSSTMSDTLLRARVISESGLSVSGLYQPVAMMSAQVFLPISTSIAMFLFPVLTAHLARGDQEGASFVLNKAIRLSLLIITPGILGMLIGKSAFIRILFTPSFDPAGDVIALQLLGELPRSAAYSLGGLLLPAGLVIPWMIVGLATVSLQVGLGWVLVPYLGIEGLAIAFIASWALNLGITWNITHRQTAVRLNRGNFMLFSLALSLVLSVFVMDRIDQPLSIASGAVALAGWFGFVVRPSEYRRLVRMIRDARKRFARRAQPSSDKLVGPR